MSFTVLESVSGALAGQTGYDSQLGSGYLDAATRTGVLLCQGVADNSLKVPASAADVLRAKGVSVYSPLKEPYDVTNGIQDAAADFVDVVKRGTIWGRSEEACAPTDTVYARAIAKGANTVLGSFRNDADANMATVTLGGSYAQNETCTIQLTVTKDGVANLLPACVATGDAAPTLTELSAALTAALVLQEDNGFDVADTDGEVTITPRAGVTSIAIAVSESSTSGTITVDDATVEPTCFAVPGARFCATSTSTNPVKLEVNFP